AHGDRGHQQHRDVRGGRDLLGGAGADGPGRDRRTALSGAGGAGGRSACPDLLEGAAMRSPDAHSRQDGDTVEVRELQRTPTAVRRGRVAVAELPRWLGDAYRDVMTYLGTVGAAPAGPPFAWYERVDAGFRVGAGFPVTASVPGNGRVHPSSLPGGRAVVVWHRGPDDGLAAAYADAEAEVERLGG